MGIVTKKVWKCDVCEHEWLSRDDTKPLRCANCKTPYWDKSRRAVEQAREALKLKQKRRKDEL